MELRDYLMILRIRWRTVLVSTSLVLAGAVVYSLIATPVYVAQSSLFLSVSVGQSSGQLSRGFAYAQSLAVLYSRVASEPVVLDPVIEDLGLDVTATDLARSVVAQTPRDAVLIQIRVSRSDPRLAARIADAIAGELTSTVGELLPESTQTSESGTAGREVPVRLTTVAPAAVPTSPTSPRIIVDLTFALALGLAAGCVLALLRESVSGRVSRREAACVTRAPLVATLTGRRLRRSASVLSRLRSRGARQGRPEEITGPREYRDEVLQLRAGFEHLRVQRGLRSVVFTSAVDGACTTSVVCGLADALAQTGIRVLLVDADVRGPVLARRYGLPDDPGLTTVLDGELAWSAAVAEPGPGMPALLPAGGRPEDPSAVLAEGALAELLHEAADSYDVVLVKAPALLCFADGLLLTALADGVFLVVEECSGNRDALGASVEALELAGAHLLGVVLTS
jgi:succinoglycan biosynthesis transport protein ExoP